MGRMMQNRFDRRSLVGMSLAVGTAGIAAVTGLSTVFAGRAQAQVPAGSKLKEVLSRGRLIVGTGSDIPPFYFKNDAGELAGFEIDLARLLAANLFNDPGKIDFVVQSSDARIPNLLSNRIDVTIQNLTVTPARAQQVEFTLPYYRAGQGLLVLAGGPYKDYQALKSAGSRITVSALQNVTAADWVRAALPEAKVDQYPTPDAALQALDAGRAQAHMITHGRVQYTVAQFPQRYADAGFTWRANSIAAAVRPNDQPWLNWLNTALREAMSGVGFDDFAAIYKRWLGVDVPPPKLGFPREAAA